MRVMVFRKFFRPSVDPFNPLKSQPNRPLISRRPKKDERPGISPGASRYGPGLSRSQRLQRKIELTAAGLQRGGAAHRRI